MRLETLLPLGKVDPGLRAPEIALDLATIGRGFAVLDLGWLKLSGFLAWLAWIFIHIWYLIGFRNRISVMLQWAWAYLTYRRVARIIYVEKTPVGAPDTSARR